MGKMVGLSRNLKIAWLNKTVELLSENLSEEEFKEQLNDYLDFEIKSPTNKRKTREILMHIWYYDDPGTRTLREDAKTLVHKDPDDVLLYHWCLMLATYPVFVDICRLIGKLSEFEEEITIKQVKQKIFDEWGERSTLFHCIDKIIATMKDLGTLHADKPGRYKIVKHEIKNAEASAFIAATGMKIENRDYCSLQKLREMGYMFPFSYHLKKEMLMTNEQFIVTNVSGEMMIGMKDKL